MDWPVRGERGGTSRLGATVVDCAWRHWGGDGPRLFTAGCGGGQSAPASGSATTAPASGPVTSGTTDADRTAAVCSAWVDADAAGAEVLLNTDLASATPEQLEATVKEFWTRQEPILVSMN
jgi:hypothetical protein